MHGFACLQSRFPRHFDIVDTAAEPVFLAVAHCVPAALTDNSPAVAGDARCIVLFPALYDIPGQKRCRDNSSTNILCIGMVLQATVRGVGLFARLSHPPPYQGSTIAHCALMRMLMRKHT